MADEGSNAQGGTDNQGGSTGDSGQTSQGQAGQSILTTSPQGQQAGQTGAVSTGQVLPAWRQTLPETIRNEKFFDNFKGNDWSEVGPVMAKSNLEAQKMIGGSIRIPQTNDTPQKKQEFEAKVNAWRGVPSKAEEYDVVAPVINGTPLDTELVSGFTERAHKMGFSNKQLQFVLNEYAEAQNRVIGQYQTSQKEALNELQKEWGPNFARKAVLAQRIVREIGGQQVMELLDQTGLGNSPILVKFFADLGEWAAEDGYIPAEIAGVEGPEQAKKRISEIQYDKNHPYNSKVNDAAHKEAVEEMRRLHEIAYGSK